MPVYRSVALVALAALLLPLAWAGAEAADASETPVILYDWPDERETGGSSYAFAGMSFYSTSEGDSGQQVVMGAGTEVEIGDNVRIRIEFWTGEGSRFTF
jgi:hypothetical protein